MKINYVTAKEPAPQNKKDSAKNQVQKKLKNKKRELTRSEYDDLRQIEWVPVDPYAD